MVQNLKVTNLFSKKKKDLTRKAQKKKKFEKTSCSKLRGFETGMKWIGFGLNEPTGAHTRLKWFTPPN